MSQIAQNIISLKQEVPDHIKIIAVSKTMPVSDIMLAYDTGHRLFGENRVKELIGKKDSLPPDIEWHMIGHLQTNKVKYIVPFITLIHSIHSFKLLKTIDTEAGKAGRTVDCLLQFHIAEEETKSGFTREEAGKMLQSNEFRELGRVRICGVMGMATFTDDMEKVRLEFRNLAAVFRELKNKFFSHSDEFREISMGMSGDFLVAIEEGSTMVRIGSIIFGERKQ
ncbi:MAG TPA: YggS family pyridoxal phosphate-dependent enzyme [Bacteroidales bacterium]|nr:YggS family pyridoxal phosphate-dependent enzyme [Bacteroidales bacterium]HPF02853.1 YggS family pyridoxal phosphate-dependent enzyme [Bacteroidales bacterium]HPJ58414.1 YggS family pyridoxal phosphate-dependent enzyme [Bacteroidales bacterium]HPR10780.1 YggS family pyridoxal phosphate-dependent enzyme [Bacteroidales bacterium]HRW86071.1 YggS family pyridoxal phosphate-dependent enzyme [Bacteroidales bacterium]